MLPSTNKIVDDQFTVIDDFGASLAKDALLAEIIIADFMKKALLDSFN